jgi:mutual gliding-motility protein MglA
MVLFNYSTREITAKIVYYGPGLCGKTTNLHHIHGKLDEATRGKMISLSTEADRTLFFDFLPINLGTIRGMKVRFQLYTVPGQVFYNATRKLVLRGVDAVVFVADSQREMLDANKESYLNLKENLRENGFDPETIPLVMQYNKRDLPNCLPIDVLEKELNERNMPYSEAEAINGKGVLKTLQMVGKILMNDIMKRYNLKSQAGGDTPAAVEAAPEPVAVAAPAHVPSAPVAAARQAAPAAVAQPRMAAVAAAPDAAINAANAEHLGRIDGQLQRLTEEIGQIAQALFDTRSHQEQLATTLEKLVSSQNDLHLLILAQKEMLDQLATASSSANRIEDKVAAIEGRTDELLRSIKSRPALPAVKQGFWAKRIFEM